MDSDPPTIPQPLPPKKHSPFYYALRGLREAARSERNFKVHLVGLSLTLLAGSLVALSLTEWALLVVAISQVLTAELMNTALEKTLDRVSLEFHPLTQVAKDIAAAGVLLSVLGAVAIGLLILGPPWWQLFLNISG